MRHSSAQAPDDDRDHLPVKTVRESVDPAPVQHLEDWDPYADAELRRRKERTETMIRRAHEAAT